MFIDEVQDFLALPTDLEDAFSQARSLGSDLPSLTSTEGNCPPSLRSGVDSNARNKIIFGLNAEDAAEMAK